MIPTGWSVACCCVVVRRPARVSEVAFDRAPLGARVYLGLRDGEVVHFGVGGDTERLVAALRAAGVQVSGA